MFCLTLPGSHTVIGEDGNDVVERGAQFTAADSIDLGAGSDTLRLDGDYAAGVNFGPDTLRNVETIELAGGHSYRLIPQDATVAPGATLTIDGSALGSGDTLTVIGWAETDGWLVLHGGGGADILLGGAGADTIDGGAGADLMLGGMGDDTYVVDSAGDTIIEFAGGGTDTVLSTIGDTLPDTSEIENLTLLGTARWGFGNALDNAITGNAEDNLLIGGDGNDTLTGGAGDDTLSGGAGNDTAVFSGRYHDYAIGRWGQDTVVQDLAGSDGRDLLRDVESLRFADRTVSLSEPLPPANQAPDAAADSAVTREQVPVTIAVLANDRDPDGDALRLSGATDGTSGSVTANPDGTLTYRPLGHFHGTDTVRYTVEDGHGGSATAEVTITVAPANDAPEAAPDAAATLQDVPVTLSPLLNDHDADGDALSIVAVTDGDHGTVALNPDGTVTYTPAAGFHGNDGFSYAVSDGHGGIATAGVTVAVDLPAPGGGGSGGSSDGIIHPHAIAPQQPGDIVGPRLTNTGAGASPREHVTFGQVFAAGDVRPEDSLVARIDGHDVAVQMDVKATNPDGSVRHAILTFDSPCLAAGGAVDVMLAKGVAGAAGAAVTADTILAHGYDLKLALTLHNDDGSTSRPVTLDAADLLRQAAAGGHLETWMQGTQAGEFRVAAPINDHLRAVFDIRGYADGTVRTDVSVASESTYKAGIQTFTYDAVITGNGQTAFSDAGIAHHRNATWHQEVWSGGAPHDFVAYDVDYLVKTGAVPAFDTSVGISSALLDAELADIDAADTGPMGTGTVRTYMPGVGGREDLGPVTTWAARYLLSQDPRAERVMMANADAAGSVPWHFRDEETGQFVTVDRHPYLWLDERGAQWPDPLPNHVAVLRQYTGWTPDISHEPALSYVPYLVSGSHYRLDELLAQASYDLTALYPAARGCGAGIMEVGTTRGTAWGLRDLADAAWIAPDNHPMKDYFESKLTGSLDHLVQEYVTGGAMDAAGAVEGWLPAMPGREPGFGTPWQDEYLAYVFGTITQRGWDQAEQMLGWQENYIAGLFTNGENGFNPLMGTVYYIGLADPPHTPFSSWADVGRLTTAYEGQEPAALLNSYVGGYADNAKAALASIITATGSPDAMEAYGFILGAAPWLAQAQSYVADPTWLVTPVLPDGSRLTLDRMSVAWGSDDVRLHAGGPGWLLHGGAGNDVVTAICDTNLLFGGDGNDILIGGSSNDYLFGGSGNDRLAAGDGDDWLKGGPGADTFVFGQARLGHDTIADFQPGTDHLEIAGALGTSAEAILAGATADTAGDTVLHLGDGTITLLGVTPCHLHADSILIA